MRTRPTREIQQVSTIPADPRTYVFRVYFPDSRGTEQEMRDSWSVEALRVVAWVTTHVIDQDGDDVEHSFLYVRPSEWPYVVDSENTAVDAPDLCIVKECATEAERDKEIERLERLVELMIEKRLSEREVA